jgi:hypothetical protein
MKQEEEQVDVDGIFEDVRERNSHVMGCQGEDDADILWANEEPDDDGTKDWAMKIIMEN